MILDRLLNFAALLDAIARENGVDAGDMEVRFGDEARMGLSGIPCAWAMISGKDSRHASPQAARHLGCPAGPTS